MTNFLQKLMFWRSDEESEPAARVPDSGPTDPPSSDASETRDDRPSRAASEPEQHFRKNLFEE